MEKSPKNKHKTETARYFEKLIKRASLYKQLQEELEFRDMMSGFVPIYPKSDKERQDRE